MRWFPECVSALDDLITRVNLQTCTWIWRLNSSSGVAKPLMPVNDAYFESRHPPALHGGVPFRPPPAYLSREGEVVLAERPQGHGQTGSGTELSPSCLASAPEAESCCGLSQDTFDIRILMAKSVKYTVNFLEAKEGDLHRYWYPGPSS